MGFKGIVSDHNPTNSSKSRIFPHHRQAVTSESMLKKNPVPIHSLGSEFQQVNTSVSVWSDRATKTGVHRATPLHARRAVRTRAHVVRN